MPRSSPWLCPPFPASCPCRFAVSRLQPPPPQTARRISRTPLSCPLHAKGYGTYRLGALSGRARSALGSLRTARACQRAPPYSTSSSRSPDDSSPASNGAGPSSRPTASQGKAPARVPDPEVVDPAPQLRVDLRDHCPTGWDRERRNTSLSLCSNAVRFFSFGVYCGRQRPRSDRRRRKSKPRNPKPPPDSGPRSGSSPRSAEDRVSPTPLGVAGLPPSPASLPPVVVHEDH